MTIRELKERIMSWHSDEVEPQETMVSLDKVCNMLYTMLTTQDINDYYYVTAPAYDNVVDFVEHFRKTMEK